MSGFASLNILLGIAGSIVLVTIISFFLSIYFIISSLLGKRSLFNFGSIISVTILSIVAFGLFFVFPVAVDNKINGFIPNQEQYLPEISNEARGILLIL